MFKCLFDRNVINISDVLTILMYNDLSIGETQENSKRPGKSFSSIMPGECSDPGKHLQLIELRVMNTTSCELVTETCVWELRVVCDLNFSDHLASELHHLSAPVVHVTIIVERFLKGLVLSSGVFHIDDVGYFLLIFFHVVCFDDTTLLDAIVTYLRGE